MTQLDVLYRYGTPPSEAAMAAIARVREVYGIRKLEFNEAEKIIRIEYDASRLTESVIYQFLRRAGLTVVETISMFAPPAPPPPAETPAS